MTFQPDRLSSVVGKEEQKVRSFENPAPRTSWRYSASHTKPLSVVNGIWTNEETIEQLVDRLSNPSLIPDSKTFAIVFKEFINWQESYVDVCNSTHVYRIIQRLVNEKSFWPRREFMALINTKLLNLCMPLELFDLLFEKKDVELLSLALEKLTNISESLLVKILQFFLSLEDSKNISAVNNLFSNEVSDYPCPLSTKVSKLVNYVLRYPVHNEFILIALKTMSFNQVLILCHYLLYLLNTIPVSKKYGLMLDQVIEWTNILLDAHFNQFIIGKDSHSLIFSLQTSVNGQLKIINELALAEELKLTLEGNKAAIPCFTSINSPFHILRI